MPKMHSLQTDYSITPESRMFPFVRRRGDGPTWAPNLYILGGDRAETMV